MRPVVLLVEDEPSVQHSLAAFLTLNGFHPLSAEDVDEAFKILRTEHVDAAILDIRLPDRTGQQRNGFTLLQFLRALPYHRRTPTIMFTGSAVSDEDQQRASALGAQIFVKPVPYRQFIQEVNRMLGEVDRS